MPGQREYRLSATVPGDVHLDLMRAGILPDLFVGKNLDHAHWVERQDWWYETTFPTPAGMAARRASLVFHGLDTYATIWLNGQCLGRADNMFIRHEFDATPCLRPKGKNTLTLRFAAPAYSIPIDPDHIAVTPTWSPERLFCRKAQMSFGWDIAPRLMTIGIWRPIELLLIDTARITNVWVRQERRSNRAAVLHIQVTVEWAASRAGKARICGRIHNTPWTVQADFHPGPNHIHHRITIKDPPLWWPIGYGKPALCRCIARLEFAGRVLDTYQAQIGLRNVALRQDPQPSGATSFAFECNGKTMRVTGLNWTPLDAIFARITPARITRTLEALAGIGCNMLRVWGGGIYEPPHFYRECDRLGIMVWQDFMMACGWYPQTGDFAARLAAEARQVIADLRCHPCLALWSGDNEVDLFYPRRAGNNQLTRRVLPRLCRRLNPEVPYIPSSPYSPHARNPNCPTEGDVHHYVHGRDYRDPGMWALRSRFLSEFGCLSLPSLKVIRRYIPKKSRWPLTNDMWSFHGTDTLRYGRFRGPAMILKALAAARRPLPRTIAAAVHASQKFQREAIVAWIERFCRDPEFDGFLLWNVADCWPEMSDAVIDYAGHPKLVFKKLKALFARVRAWRPAR